MRQSFLSISEEAAEQDSIIKSSSVISDLHLPSILKIKLKLKFKTIFYYNTLALVFERSY